MTNRRLTLAEKLVAIHQAEVLVKTHHSLMKQIREANDSFACFVSGQSQKHAHPELNDMVRKIWVDELKAKVEDLEVDIMDCTFDQLYRNFAEEE